MVALHYWLLSVKEKLSHDKYLFDADSFVEGKNSNHVSVTCPCMNKSQLVFLQVNVSFDIARLISC